MEQNETITVTLNVERLKKIFSEVYLEGYYDRDWHISEDEADEKASKLDVLKLLKRCI